MCKPLSWICAAARHTTSRAVDALARLVRPKQSDIPVRDDFEIDRLRWYYDPSKNPKPAADRLCDSISLDDAGSNCDKQLVKEVSQFAEEADYKQELLSEVPRMQMLICSLQYQIQAKTTRCLELQQIIGAWKKHYSQLENSFIRECQHCKRTSAEKRASVYSDTTVC
ncbi:hypothetical protein GGI07_001597 [Coemansia sp. Benny D115]|nr:hypothetical protein GGI07_001597 [Coemansia sp. Benny D115]